MDNFEVVQPLRIDAPAVQSEALTPTEALIAIERKTIPVLADFQYKISGIAASIESLKNDRQSFIVNYVQNRFQVPIHEGVERVEIFSGHLMQGHFVERLTEYISKGYTLIQQTPIQGATVCYFAKPEVTRDAIEAQFKVEAEVECERQIVNAEQRLTATRDKLTAYKKSVQRELAEVRTLQEIMKDVK